MVHFKTKNKRAWCGDSMAVIVTDELKKVTCPACLRRLRARGTGRLTSSG